MMSILDKIVGETRTLIAARKRETSIAVLEKRSVYSLPRQSFNKALRSQRLACITEIKKASPSKGVIRADFNPEWIASRYTESGSSAISVLTEPLFFQGRLDYLAKVRGVTTLPLLRKDFIVDTYQLIEARAYGADAVLLIAAVLDKHALHDLHQAASELELDCLVEIYAPAELEKIDFSQVSILGVNNRNLHTFEVDLTHSTRLFKQLPSHVVRVSESGINTVQDLHFLMEHQTDAVLIGESLMRAEDPGRQLQTLCDGIASFVSTPANFE